MVVFRRKLDSITKGCWAGSYLSEGTNIVEEGETAPAEEG